MSRDSHQYALEAMGAGISHRGPDGEGTWFDHAAGVGLCHRRLSILDLSENGRQPMTSESGRRVIVYNGEVYNFEELRKELGNYGFTFRGGSDTEVVLAAIERWGVDGAVKRMIGMFAFAVWDKESRTLTIARDRLGIKPLYYAEHGEGLVFGSELRAVTAFPGFEAGVNRDALALYARYNNVPAPWSIFEGVRKLEPGMILEICAGGEKLVARRWAFWSAREISVAGTEHPFAGSQEEAEDELDRLLRSAVKRRMVADVPLGGFLSGGIDSSTVVALMQAQSDRPVKTFTIGSESAEYNEANHARTVAEHLGTEHHELIVSPEQAMGAIGALPEVYDEPFADASQIPTFLVSQMARESVTVALSGDGGDELFGGYNRYLWAERIWNKAKFLPSGIRRMLTRPVAGRTESWWDERYSRLEKFLPASMRVTEAGVKFHKTAGLLGSRSRAEFYGGMLCQWRNAKELVPGALPMDDLSRGGEAGFGSFTEFMMCADLGHYLPNTILTKLDRASMAVGLEARVPVLDHRVVEFAWRLPLSMKIAGGNGKQILRNVLGRYVPGEVFDRPKQGFSVPIGDWLRGPMRDWAEDLLGEKRLREDGYFEPAVVRGTWERFLAGGSLQYPMWNVLMFQQWAAAYASRQKRGQWPVAA